MIASPMTIEELFARLLHECRRYGVHSVSATSPGVAHWRVVIDRPTWVALEIEQELRRYLTMSVFVEVIGGGPGVSADGGIRQDLR